MNVSRRGHLLGCSQVSKGTAQRVHGICLSLALEECRFQDLGFSSGAADFYKFFGQILRISRAVEVCFLRFKIDEGLADALFSIFKIGAKEG